MTIVCLGWGSLVWDPRELPIRTWYSDGPPMPIEFARESRDGRITLVVAEESPPLPVLWSVLNVSSLIDARQALAAREKIQEKNFERSIGAWSRELSTNHAEVASVKAWAETMDVSGVVWTALKPRFSHQLRMPSCEEIVEYLSGLEGDTRRFAEEYVRRAPPEIETPYRVEIERQLGWTFMSVWP